MSIILLWLLFCWLFCVSAEVANCDLHVRFKRSANCVAHERGGDDCDGQVDCVYCGLHLRCAFWRSIAHAKIPSGTGQYSSLISDGKNS